MDDWVAPLSRAREVQLGSGEVLLHSVQAQNSLFLVANGCLEVRASKSSDAFGERIRERPGAVIGEISFFDGNTRSAMIRAPSRPTCSN